MLDMTLGIAIVCGLGWTVIVKVWVFLLLFINIPTVAWGDEARPGIPSHFDLTEKYSAIVAKPHSKKTKNIIKYLTVFPFTRLNSSERAAFAQFSIDTTSKITSTINVKELINLIANAPYATSNINGKHYKSIEESTWYFVDGNLAAVEETTAKLYSLLLQHKMSLNEMYKHMRQINLYVQTRPFLYFSMPVELGLVTSVESALNYSLALSEFTKFDFETNRAFVLLELLSVYPEKSIDLTIDLMLSVFRNVHRRGAFELGLLGQVLSEKKQLTAKDWVEISKYFQTNDYLEKDKNEFANQVRKIFLTRLKPFYQTNPSNQDINTVRSHLKVGLTEWLYYKSIKSINAASPYVVEYPKINIQTQKTITPINNCAGIFH